MQTSVVLAGDVAGGEADDAGQRLGVQQHQGCGHMLGRYSFAPPAGPELRPLRDPANPDNDQ
jgi:hypothetical protein